MTDVPLFVLSANPAEPQHLADRVPQPRLFDAEAEPTEQQMESPWLFYISALLAGIIIGAAIIALIEWDVRRRRRQRD